VCLCVSHTRPWDPKPESVPSQSPKRDPHEGEKGRRKGREEYVFYVYCTVVIQERRVKGKFFFPPDSIRAFARARKRNWIFFFFFLHRRRHRCRRRPCRSYLLDARPESSGRPGSEESLLPSLSLLLSHSHKSLSPSLCLSGTKLSSLCSLEPLDSDYYYIGQQA